MYSPPQVRQLSYHRTNFWIAVSQKSATILCDLISASLSSRKRWRWPDSKFLRFKKKWTIIVNADSLRFALWSAVSFFGTHMAHNLLNIGCSVTILWNKGQEVCAKWLLEQLKMNFDGCYALCIKNFYHRPHTSESAGAGIIASIFNRCNDAFVRTLEVPLVHASCGFFTLSRTLSRFTQYKV